MGAKGNGPRPQFGEQIPPFLDGLIDETDRLRHGIVRSSLPGKPLISLQQKPHSRVGVYGVFLFLKP
jgi:hypothetical protein